MPYRKPTQRDFEDLESLGDMIATEQYNAEGGNKTTDAITGSQQYAATTYTVSDILQGTLNFRDPSESLLVTNLALTDHLKDLYGQGAHSLARFSSTEANQLTSNGTGPGTSNGVASDAFDPSTGFIRQEWVETLPSTHPNGGFLWATKGKASREMHLPTSASIRDDISKHKQYPDMPPEWRHPWNMDRVGGAVGGEAKIYYDANQSSSVLGESASAGGQQGAFGFLSPEEEQFYISMAWPFKNVVNEFERANRPDVAEKAKAITKPQYRGMRILVYCVQTKKAVVCTPGDWGPHPYYSNGAVQRSSINGSFFGLSPDTHWALGTVGKEDFMIGIMPDSTPLGPYTPQNASQGSVGGDVGGFVPVSSAFINTPEEMVFAGTKITQHPNFMMDTAINVFTKGYTVDPRSASITPAKNPTQPTKGFLMPSLLNWIWYCMEGGFIFGGYLGSYTYKMATFNKSRISNHAKGGAIDIGRLGHASYGNGVTFSLADLSKSRPVMEMLINFMATLPNSVKPKEIGGPYATGPSSPLKVYLDPGHIHFGYDEFMCGSLLTALKPPRSGGGSGGGRYS
jgi:hypothetical protein